VSYSVLRGEREGDQGRCWLTFKTSSGPGGTDAGAAAAWRVALNQTSDYWPDFSSLLDYDLMSTSSIPLVFSPLTFPQCWISAELGVLTSSTFHLMPSVVCLGHCEFCYLRRLKGEKELIKIVLQIKVTSILLCLHRRR
jgi:hypothetical protein